MRNFIFIGLFFQCFCKWGFALYSSTELDIYNVIMKPYGISFKDDFILKVSPDIEKCADLNKSLEDCSSIAADLTSSITASELSKLKSLSRSCTSGSFNCFYNEVKSDLSLKGLFKRVQSTIRKLCKQQCWKTMQFVVNKCIQLRQSAIKESDQMYLQFVTDVIQSLCIQQDKSSCADKFINGLLKNNSDPQVCDVTKNIKENKCSSQCHKDVGEFYNTLGCCIGSVTNIMDCYSIKPQNNSYGVFVKEGYSRCHLKVPPACTTSPKFQCPLTPQESSTSSPVANSSASSSKSPVSTSSKGNQIAGICIAVLICIGGAVIVGNYFYRRMKRREMIRFEDYGYSRLKMLEDDFYFDVEDDDENTGLVQA